MKVTAGFIAAVDEAMFHARGNNDDVAFHQFRPFVADFSAQLAFEHEQNLIAVFMRFGFVAGRVASLERHHCRLAALARLQHLKPFLRLRDVT